MIRITSIDQALALRGTIHELAIIRAIQFMSDGYRRLCSHLLMMNNE